MDSIEKPRYTQNWRVWHHKLADGSKRLILDSNNAMADASFLNDTAPTSTVFTLGNADDAFIKMVPSLLFIVGMKFLDIQNLDLIREMEMQMIFVYTGFKPGFIMFKNATQHQTGKCMILQDLI